MLRPRLVCFHKLKRNRFVYICRAPVFTANWAWVDFNHPSEEQLKGSTQAVGRGPSRRASQRAEPGRSKARRHAVKSSVLWFTTLRGTAVQCQVSNATSGPCLLSHGELKVARHQANRTPWKMIVVLRVRTCKVQLFRRWREASQTAWEAGKENGKLQAGDH